MVWGNSSPEVTSRLMLSICVQLLRLYYLYVLLLTAYIVILWKYINRNYTIKVLQTFWKPHAALLKCIELSWLNTDSEIDVSFCGFQFIMFFKVFGDLMVYNFSLTLWILKFSRSRRKEFSMRAIISSSNWIGFQNVLSHNIPTTVTTIKLFFPQASQALISQKLSSDCCSAVVAQELEIKRHVVTTIVVSNNWKSNATVIQHPSSDLASWRQIKEVFL